MGGTEYCAEPANELNYSAVSICDKQQLIDHNVFEGLGNCFVNFTKNEEVANRNNYTLLLQERNLSASWQTKYQAQITADQSGVSAADMGIAAIVVVIIIMAVFSMIMMQQNNKIQQLESKMGRKAEK